MDYQYDDRKDPKQNIGHPRFTPPNRRNAKVPQSGSERKDAISVGSSHDSQSVKYVKTQTTSDKSTRGSPDVTCLGTRNDLVKNKKKKRTSRKKVKKSSSGGSSLVDLSTEAEDHVTSTTSDFESSNKNKDSPKKKT